MTTADELLALFRTAYTADPDGAIDGLLSLSSCTLLARASLRATLEDSYDQYNDAVDVAAADPAVAGMLIAAFSDLTVALVAVSDHNPDPAALHVYQALTEIHQGVGSLLDELLLDEASSDR